jgi:hypothetical protein
MLQVRRFSNVWSGEWWMYPHFTINIPVVCNVLRNKFGDWCFKIAGRAEEMVPSDYKFIRLNVQHLESAISRMSMKDKPGEN